MGALLPSTVRDDLFGGLVSGVLAIPLAMGFGMFAFTALGDRFLPTAQLRASMQQL
jgi:MFS superfamily sulfate permease-like transporter